MSIDNDFLPISERLQEIDNKLERIKSDTHNLNRIATLSNKDTIIGELQKIIGKSEIRAAVLYLTKEMINATDLSAALGIHPKNLASTIAPFLGNKGYISLTQKGRVRYYQRSELVDLIGFELLPEFAPLLKSWQSKRNEGTITQTPIANETTINNTSP